MILQNLTKDLQRKLLQKFTKIHANFILWQKNLKLGKIKYMDENFTKFNKETLETIQNFLVSDKDLLFVSGFQGSGKSEIINFVLNSVNHDEILIFKHMCYQNSTIDDFLLGFYDAFRQYSINKKIILKKSLTENFAQKVSFYFKDVEKKSLIIADAFDMISKNSEIIDFLAHLGKFQNVKLILITRFNNDSYFSDKGLACETIEITANDYETFKLKVESSVENAVEEKDIKELYKQTEGYELYLRMTLRYLTTVNITLSEFIEDFKRRKLDFPDFLISRIVALVPAVYLPFLRNMASLTHSVKIDFIEHYALGDISQVHYLHRKLLISKFADEIWVKDYMKDYFLAALSVQEKIDNYKNLIAIYEQELAKSPRDRLLRLSREGIRKNIEFIKTKVPNLNKRQVLGEKGFTYIPQTASQSVQAPWYAKLTNLNRRRSIGEIQDKINKTLNEKTPQESGNAQIQSSEILSSEEKAMIEEFRRNKVKNEIELGSNAVLRLLKEAEGFEKEFDFSSAIKALKEADRVLVKAGEEKKRGDILINIARDLVKTNSFEDAIKYYKDGIKTYLETGNKDSELEIKLELALIYRRMYRFKQARETYAEVAATKGNVSKNTVAKGFLGVGEINEMDRDYKGAFENYEKALHTSDKENPDYEFLSETYFKIGALYDDGQETEKALEYYKKSITESEKAIANGKKGKYLSISHANSGLIYTENGELESAVANFEQALKIDKEENNMNGIYFAARQISLIYKDYEPTKAQEYLLAALDAARNLEDNFKIALAHLELGDYYYNSRENKLALTNYLEARKALGTNISDENEERISVRIKDMEVKMGAEEFKKIKAEYES